MQNKILSLNVLYEISINLGKDFRKYNELFNKEKNIKDIIIKIMELIKEKKYEIIENNENISLIIDKKLNFNILKILN